MAHRYFPRTEIHEALQRSKFVHSHLFGVENELVIIINGIVACSLKPGKIGFCLVYGPSGSGKTTLFDACIEVFPHLGVRHFVLPCDLSSQSAVVDAIGSQDALEAGLQLGKYICHASKDTSTPERHSKIAQLLRAANQIDLSKVTLFDQSLLVLLHDSAEINYQDQDVAQNEERPNQNVSIEDTTFEQSSQESEEPAGKKRRVSSPLKSWFFLEKTKRRVSSPLRARNVEEDVLMDNALDKKCPSVFAFESSGSFPSVRFPFTMSEKTLQAVYNCAPSKFPPYVRFVLGMMDVLDSNNRKGALVNFSTCMSLHMTRVPGIKQMELVTSSGSGRPIVHQRLNPVILRGTAYTDQTTCTETCFHQFVYDNIIGQLNAARPNEEEANHYVLTRVLGIALIGAGVSLMRFWNMISSINELLGPLRVNSAGGDTISRQLEELFITEGFHSSLLGFEKRGIDNLLSSCPFPSPEGTQKKALCCKVILAAFSDVPISLSTHAAREAVYCSVVRITSDNVNSLEVDVRMDYRIFRHMMENYVLPPPEKRGENSLARLVSKCLEALLEVKLPNNLVTAESTEAVIFGSKFELCVFSRIIVMLYCCSMAFDEFPKNCFGPIRMLQLGNTLFNGKGEFSSTTDTPDAFPVGKQITELTICERLEQSESSLSLLCNYLGNFVKPPASNKPGLRFFIARTPYLASVDIIVTCVTTTNVADQEMQEEVKVWFLECKSSQKNQSMFGSCDILSLVKDGQSTFSAVIEAATHNQKPPTVEYCIQLANRTLDQGNRERVQPLRAAQISPIHPFKLVRIMSYQASADSSIYLPGLLSSAHPDVYLPASCCCRDLRETLCNALGQTKDSTECFTFVIR